MRGLSFRRRDAIKQVKQVKQVRSFPASTASVRGARQFVEGTLSPLVPALCETAMLLVSELATNAIIHGASEFDVSVVYPTPSGRLRIEVADGDPTPPVSPSAQRSPHTEPHGRGLLLVATLSGKWGVQPFRRRAGKTVWFELSPTA
jgi:anti-sigma regulatory factor (Ser/Thr protein kinase)